MVNEAEQASLAVLARHTVADSLAELERGDKRACAEYAAEQRLKPPVNNAGWNA